MRKNNFKTALYIGIFIIIFAFVGTLSSFTVKSNVAPYINSDQNKWKNLKVLPQDISKDSLMSLMKGYNMALGVKCVYCHVPIPNSDKLDFASDEKKEKEYARSMIIMTREINSEYFNWENSEEPEKITRVKCVMCHQGAPSPTKHLKNIGYFYQQENEEAK